MQVADSTRPEGARARAFVSVLNDLDDLLASDVNSTDGDPPDQIAQQRALIAEALAAMKNKQRRREFFQNIDAEFDFSRAKNAR